MLLFVDNLINVDFSFLHPTRGLVGETWLASVTLEGELDEQGMVCDFGIVKKKLREWLNTHIDHRLLIPTLAEEIDIDHNNEATRIHWQLADDVIDITSPNQAITLVECQQITASSTAQWCINQLQKMFPETVVKLSLTFSTEVINDDFYHYSHGLKKHDGNCQRIAHGHRSKILIWKNAKLDTEAMENWARRWQDIYIGTKEDIVSSENQNFHFSYEAIQGQFRLTIPKSRCYIIAEDSTVENLAHHIASTLAAENPGNEYTVKAFEGIGKGAIAIAQR